VLATVAAGDDTITLDVVPLDVVPLEVISLDVVALENVPSAVVGVAKPVAVEPPVTVAAALGVVIISDVGVVGNAVEPSAGGTVVKPSAGGTAVEPSVGGTAVELSAGGTAVEPSAGGTAVEPSAGGTVVEPSTGGMLLDWSNGGALLEVSFIGSVPDTLDAGVVLVADWLPSMRAGSVVSIAKGSAVLAAGVVDMSWRLRRTPSSFQADLAYCSCRPARKFPAPIIPSATTTPPFAKTEEDRKSTRDITEGEKTKFITGRPLRLIMSL